MTDWRQGSAIHGIQVPIDPRSDEWMPPPGLLSRVERDQLSEIEQRTLGRNRLGFYQLFCGQCGQSGVVHKHELTDEVWLCSDCIGSHR